MVYESDFYTTRRPYSRPLVSSYSVTGSSGVVPLSTIIQLRSGHPRMPYVAHKRLVTVIHTPIRTVYHHGTLIPIRIHARVRPSVLAAELNRIRDLPRPTTESYIEKFLNSRDCIYFDDEAREIRARVDSLLRRVHVFVPRASPSDFAEEIVPERMRDDSYVRRLISGKSNAKKEAEPVSWYDVPERGNFGNLACVKYVAGKPHSTRRPYYKVADLRPSDIKNDVNLLSYYKKNLQAAENAFADQPMTERELRKARALETEWTEQQRQQQKTKREAKPEPVPEDPRESEPEVVEVAPLMNGHASETAEEPAQDAEAVSEKKKKRRKEKTGEEEAEAEAEAEAEETDVKHEREEALKRAEAFLIRQTAAARMAEEKKYFEEMRRLAKEREENDARLAEERQRAIDEERAKLELEEQKAWLAMKEAQEAKARILERRENERLEALRKAEEEKEEKDRLESIRIAEEEKQAAAAALAAQIEDEERMAVDQCLEERKARETEDRLAEIATVEGIEEPKDADKSLDETFVVEETDHEKEERPYQIINVDDVRIEPEHQEEEHEISDNPFVEEVDDRHEAGDAQPEVSPVVEENAVTEEVWPSGEEAMPAEDVVGESQEETREEAQQLDETNEETIVAEVVATTDADDVEEQAGTEQPTTEEKEEEEVEEKEEEVAAAAEAETVEEIEETFEWGDQDA